MKLLLLGANGNIRKNINSGRCGSMKVDTVTLDGPSLFKEHTITVIVSRVDTVEKRFRRAVIASWIIGRLMGYRRLDCRRKV